MTHYIVDSECLSKNPTVLGFIRPGDTVTILRGAITGTNVGTIIIIDELTPASRITESKQPNRGPYASHQPWKKKGKK